MERPIEVTSMDWSHRKVLVTGAGGFIASHLVERMVFLGAKTRAFVHYRSDGSWGWLDMSSVKSDVEVQQGDIRDYQNIREAAKGVDIIFHLAALIAIPYSYRFPLSYVRTNVEGSLNVFEAARELGTSLVVHTSTSEVYGTARQVPIPETHPLQGQSPYSATKIAADKLAEAFYASYQLPALVVRPFNTYGPRQSARAVIPTIVTQALLGERIHLGNLHPTRDLSFVADTVEGFVKAAEHPELVGEVINIGSGKEIAMGELAETILQLMGKPLEVVVDELRVRPELSEVDRLCADISKARKKLGWVPTYSLKQGLSITIDWITKNIDRYRLGTYAL
jgi:dTDP-glucose 4,6-dehydratase